MKITSRGYKIISLSNRWEGAKNVSLSSRGGVKYKCFPFEPGVYNCVPFKPGEGAINVSLSNRGGGINVSLSNREEGAINVSLSNRGGGGL